MEFFDVPSVVLGQMFHVFDLSQNLGQCVYASGERLRFLDSSNRVVSSGLRFIRSSMVPRQEETWKLGKQNSENTGEGDMIRV